MKRVYGICHFVKKKTPFHIQGDTIYSCVFNSYITFESFMITYNAIICVWHNQPNILWQETHLLIEI